MEHALTIPRDSNGPPDSANGGYVCGLLAAEIGGAVEVTLRAPPPLERPLELEGAGEGLALRDGETLVAEARARDPDLEPPRPPTIEEAERASRAWFKRWASHHPFPTCVVCGPERPAGDGMRIFPGALGGGERFAAPWTPAQRLADGKGHVRGQWVWAALDCPSSAPVLDPGSRGPFVLARLTARIDRPVIAGRPHAIASWSLGGEGRKQSSGAALYSESGEALAIARALWIELRG